MKKFVLHIVLLVLVIFASKSPLSAQCDASTPVIPVDLSSNPDSLWISAMIDRDGDCCGTDNNCVQFDINLSASAEGINFQIYEGAEPSGSLFYQVDCGALTPVGEPICIDGGGLVTITFCKPGANDNSFSIQSIGAPRFGPPIAVNDGCVGFLHVGNMDESTVTWRSVGPNADSFYDGYLDCTLGCDTVNVVAQAGFPDFVDFEACGLPLGGCGSATPVCDTIRAYFFSTLRADIFPENPTVCFGSAGTTISVTGSGGTSPYTYLWSTGQTTQSIFVNVGTYTVQLSDTSGCPPTFDQVTVTSFSVPILADAGSDLSVCRETGVAQLSGTVEAALGGYWFGGNGSFSFNPDSLNVEYTATAAELASGSVELFLKTTGNGSCPPDTDSVVLSFVDFSTAPTIDVVNVSCFGLSDGTATLNLVGGVPPYTIQWNTAPTQNTITASNLSAATYTVDIVDGNGCDTTLTFVVDEPALLTSSITNQNNVSCFGGNDGDATALASGGTSPYSYAWSSSTSNDLASDLAAGVYLLTATDSQSCSSTSSVTITEPTQITITLNSVNSVCNSGNGSITSTVTGGTSGYTYLWNNGSITSSIGPLTAGVYELTVTDANACTMTAFDVIADPFPTVTLLDSSHVSCYGGNDGTAQISVFGGTTPYTYIWNSGEASDVAVALTAGLNSVTVTDASGCQGAEAVLLLQPDSIAISITTIDATCFGTPDGEAQAMVSGGTSPYFYSWPNGESTDNSTGLVVGTYELTVTDDNSCTNTQVFLIQEPNAVIVTFSQEEVSCKGGNDGSIDVDISGGTTPYSYSWSNSSSASSLQNITAGQYSVTIEDGNGCSNINTFTITEPEFALSVTASSIAVSCFGGNDGEALSSVSGGMTPYTYVWSNNQSTANISGVAAGTYSVTVFDANLCGVNNSSSTIVTQPSTSLSVSATATGVSCFGGSDGSISSFAAGGTTPYSYSWSNSETTDDVSNLTSGSYSLTLTDANGCVATSASISVTQPTALNVSVTKTDIACNGQNTGMASTSVSGGNNPYTYLWSTGHSIPNRVSLAPGTYTITVTDASSCTSSQTVVIAQPDAITLTVNPVNTSCNGGNDGTATANVSGGQSPYSYQWSLSAAFQATQTAINLPAGTYQIVVTDDNNCTESGQVTVGQPQPLTLEAVPIADSICPGASTVIGALATGGNGGFIYTWDNGLGQGQSHTVSPSESTVYEVVVQDALGCTGNNANVAVEVMNLDNNTLDVLSSGSVCDGESAEVTATFVEKYPPYVYNWTPNLGNDLGTFTVSPDEPIWYKMSVTDKCGNVIEDSVLVDVFPLPLVSLAPISGEGCEPLTVLFSNLATNTVPVTYLWSFGDGSTSNLASPSFEYNAEGTYNVSLMVVSDNNCSVTNADLSQVIVNPLPEPAFKPFPKVTDTRTPSIQFQNNSNGSTSYEWSYGDGDTSNSLNDSHTYQDTGTYVVSLTAISEYGCSATVVDYVIITPYFELHVPNAFTPGSTMGGSYNPDSPDNTVFFPFTDFVKEYKLNVFNRWGELIFESTDINIGWDGYYRGVLCQQDVYVWKIYVKYIDDSEKNQAGDVTLIR